MSRVEPSPSVPSSGARSRPRRWRRRWRCGRWAIAALLVALGHRLAAAALVDHGVAGALLAGGGDLWTIIAAAAFLLLRLAVFTALGCAPAVLAAWAYRSITAP